MGNQSGGELSTDKYLIDSRLGQTVAAVDKLSKRFIELKSSILTIALASNESSDLLRGTFLPVPMAARLEFTSVTPSPDMIEEEVETTMVPSDRRRSRQLNASNKIS